MKCIKQYIRKRALIKVHTVTDQDLINDIYLTRMMQKDNWDSDMCDDLRSMMIFRRCWRERFVKRLKAL